MTGRDRTPAAGDWGTASRHFRPRHQSSPAADCRAAADYAAPGKKSVGLGSPYSVALIQRFSSFSSRSKNAFAQKSNQKFAQDSIGKQQPFVGECDPVVVFEQKPFAD